MTTVTNTLNITDYLKYANLQMAAEAFIRDPSTGVLAPSGDDLIKVLVKGNNHASKFTETQANEFADPVNGWKVLDQRINSGTGFSGTLFQNNKTGELVLSFRSTEFIDDAVRDNLATNTMEIKDTGWAWGQLADMQDWYGQLWEKGLLTAPGTFSVTGYSLGGHLATVFNLLYPGVAQQVITFNGAGVGKIENGYTLQGLLNQFTELRDNPGKIIANFTDPDLKALYLSLSAQPFSNLAAVDAAKTAVIALYPDAANTPINPQTQLPAQARMVWDSLNEISEMMKEAERLQTLKAGGGDNASATPADIANTAILAERLNYRMALHIVSRHSGSDSLLGGLANAFLGKEYLSAAGLSPQYDVLGDTSPSAVANSQWHYSTDGKDTPIFIEDQPLYRGGVVGAAAIESLTRFSIKLLVDQYYYKDFGDTHSLVLLVDSLSAQNVLLKLVDPAQVADPERYKKEVLPQLNAILREASWRKKENGDMAIGEGQGKAEGDVLENVVNALADLVRGPRGYADHLKGNPEGNTWAEIKDSQGNSYTGRESLYNKLKEITDSTTYSALAGKFTLAVADGSLQSSARKDFFAYAALYSLSPFVLSPIGNGNALAQSLGENWGDIYEAWAKDKAMLNAGPTPLDNLQISDHWLADRASFLERKNWFNRENLNPLNSGYTVNSGDASYLADSTYFYDAANNYKIAQGFNPDSPSDSIHRYYFADQSANGGHEFAGGGVEDHLYGGSENDILAGKAGNDWLEGASGDDKLDGGKDNDFLIGGAGDDAYQYTAGDGNDKIIDADGKNKIIIGSTELSGASKEDYSLESNGNQKWSVNSGEYIYEIDRHGHTLTISGTALGGAGNSITVEKITDAKAVKDRFGIDLPFVDAIALTEDSQNYFVKYTSAITKNEKPVDQVEAATEKNLQAFNLSFNRTFSAGDKITLCLDNCTNVSQSDLKLVVGGQTLDFSSGNITLDATVGQSFLAMSMLEQSDITGNGSATFHAVISSTDDQGVVTSAESNIFAVDIKDNGTFSLRSGEDDSRYNYADRINGEANSELHGGLGNDILTSNVEGNVHLYGDVGHDALLGRSGNDEMYGGLGNDLLAGGVGNDHLEGGDGNDLISGGFDNDWIQGGEGGDWLFSGSYFGNPVDVIRLVDDPFYTFSSSINRPDFEGWVTFENGKYVPFLAGSLFGDDDGQNLLDGGSGDDNLWGDASVDTLLGDEGEDSLYGFAGDDVLNGGDGNDTLYGDVTEGNLTTTNALGETSSIFALPQYHGNDKLDGGAGDDTLVGDGGNDVLSGSDGDDFLFGDNNKLDMQWHGDDYLDGGAGNDQLVGNGGNDVLIGGSGDDAEWGGEGSDRLEGGVGNDTLYGDNGDGAGTAGDDYLDGGDGADILWGGAGDDALVGGKGDDKLYGEYGANNLDGGDGNDTLNSGGSGSELHGGAGDDKIESAGGGNQLYGEDGDDTMTAGGGDNTLLGGEGADVLTALGGNSYLYGGAGNNTLAAYDGGNTLIAGTGDDRLTADGGSNYLQGGAGSDTLVATGGNNTLMGAAGDDVLMVSGMGNYLNGGEGSDSYVLDPGFGVVHIDDPDFDNIVQLNRAYAGSGIVFGLGSLKLSFANGDELHIDGFDPADPYNTCSIKEFRFQDRTLTLQDILDLGGVNLLGITGADINGTDQTDTLVGTDQGERICGLAGNDSIDTGFGNDYIEGGAGNDTIDGGFGRDIMDGGTGNDTYYVDTASDTIIEGADKNLSPADIALGISSGYDTVNASVTYTLAANLEALNLTESGDINGTGNALDNSIHGNDGNNVLQGLGGNDLINGGAGADTMLGGTGDDTYFVDNAADVIIENAGEGYDVVASQVSFALGDNLEDLYLQGTDNIDGIGNDLDNNISGNSGDNLLVGGGGNDQFYDGLGTDTMMGGDGNDTYFVQDAGDIVIENEDEGFDEVTSTVSFALSDNVENLYLAGVGNMDGSGNDLSNYISGNGYSNVLLGGGGNDTLMAADGGDVLDGGTGADIMNGGKGADTYYVDNAGDQVIEDSVGTTYQNYWGNSYTIADIDTVNSTISYTLGSNVENLNLLGSDDINGTGNELNNVVNGNDGENVLDGGAGNDVLDGGAGADIMMGGAGSDVYYVDNVDDQVIDSVAGVTSTGWNWVWTGYNYQYQPYSYVSPDHEIVNSSVTYSLGNNLEDLNLTGTNNIDGIGNELNNAITGNDGDNMLVGGVGNDTLNGGDGNDLLDGGDGYDTLFGGAGSDTLNGGAGDDYYTVTELGDVVIEEADNGYDQVYASVDITLSDNVENLYMNDGATVGIGNDLNNYIIGNDAANLIDGGAGDDYLDGHAGDDVIAGGDGNDNIYGGYDNYAYDYGNQLISNADVLSGGAGDDYVDAGSGNDTISGGAGDDVLFGGYDDGGEGGGTFTNNDIISGDDGNDSIDGGTGTDLLYGGSGDDSIYGGYSSWNGTYFDASLQSFVPASSDDFLDGGDGNDTLDGGDGNDILISGAGDDILLGGDGNDVLYGSKYGGFVEDSPVAPRAGSMEVIAPADDGSILLATEAGGDAASYILSGTIGDGSTVDASTGSGWDYDFYKFSNISAGSVISAATFSSFDTVIGLYDASGNLLIENDNADWNRSVSGNWMDSQFTYTITDNGDYYLAVSDSYNWLPGDPFSPNAGANLYDYSYNGGDYTASFTIYQPPMPSRFSNAYLDQEVSLDDMSGGYGDDTYVVDGVYGLAMDYTLNDCGDQVPFNYLDWTTDNITEYADGGYDVVLSSATFYLPDNVEELDLIFDQGTATTDPTYYADMLAYGQDGYGNDLDNLIVGNELNNYLIGGGGADTLIGGAGNDTYFVDQIDDVVVEEAGNGTDTLVSGISYSLEGTNLENLTLLDGADWGVGNEADNILIGNAGFNELYGGDGNDKLVGGGGDDNLYGGAGDDRYVFRPGDGEVYVHDDQGSDTVFIGGDLTAGDLEADRNGDDLVLWVDGMYDSITLVNWFAQPEGVGRIEFCDSPALDRAGIMALFNTPPVALDDQVATDEDAAQTVIAAGDLLANDYDADAGDTLSISGFDAVTASGNDVLQDGSGNLVLDIGDRYQSLGAGQQATDSFSYTISDSAGATSTATVNVTIEGLNDAPVVASPIADQQAVQDAAFSFQVPTGSFADIDQGDSLSYVATLADGSNLPTWLSFDAATQTFSGTPLNADVGSLEVLVTATDTGNLSASSLFALNVANVNDAPVATGDSGNATEDGGPVLLDANALLANDTDPDLVYGDMLSIVDVGQAASGAAVSLVNGNVQYDLGSLYQNLAAGQTATDTFTYTVSDAAGASSTATVTMTIAGVNDGPVAADDTATVSEDGMLVANGNVLTNDSDIDDGTLLSVGNPGTIQGVYGSLVLNSDGSYTYMLDNSLSAVQSLSVGQVVTEIFTYLASDGIATTPATLTVSITGSNDAPAVTDDAAMLQEDVSVVATGNVLANDSDVDQGAVLSVVNAGVFAGQYGQLTLLADGSYTYALDNSSASVQLLAEGQAVTEVFAYQATDGMIATPSTLTVSITGTNDAPVTVVDTAILQEHVTRMIAGNVLSNDYDIDQGAVLTVENPGAYVGAYGNLVLAADGSYVYTLNHKHAGRDFHSLHEDQMATDVFTYLATDGVATTSSSLTINIADNDKDEHHGDEHDGCDDHHAGVGSVGNHGSREDDGHHDDESGHYDLYGSKGNKKQAQTHEGLDGWQSSHSRYSNVLGSLVNRTLAGMQVDHADNPDAHAKKSSASGGGAAKEGIEEMRWSDMHLLLNTHLATTTHAMLDTDLSQQPGKGDCLTLAGAHAANDNVKVEKKDPLFGVIFG